MDLLSNKIRELRFRNGEMTQKELAGRIGVSRQTMNATENCRHAPTVAVAMRMADVFCVSAGELLELDYDGKPAHRADYPEKLVEIECRREPIEEASTGQISLASLRNVIGS